MNVHLTMWEIRKSICLRRHDGIYAHSYTKGFPYDPWRAVSEGGYWETYMHKIIQLMRALYNSVDEISTGVDSNKNETSVRAPNSIQ